MLDFIQALEGWGIPVMVLIILAFSFILIQLIGEFIELCGKTVPAFFKVRKWFKARKEKKDALEGQYTKTAATLEAVQKQQERVEALLADFNLHYSKDNITQRNLWMKDVNDKMKFVEERAKVYDKALDRLLSLESNVKEQVTNYKKTEEKLELNTEIMSQLYKDINRNRILDFAHGLVNARKADKPVIYSREEFRKIHRTYSDYEEFLHKYGGTNGEVDDAMTVVRDAECGRLPNIEFLEDLRD